MFSIGIDLGGTNIVAGVVDQNGKILFQKSIACDTSKGKKKLITDIKNLAHSVATDAGIDFSNICSIGMGVPGTTIQETKALCHASNLAILDGTRMSDIFPNFPKENLFIENDANAAALGELIAGSGKGVKDMIMLTLGTGVGCGIVLNGRIYGGFNGAAGEAGHMVTVFGGRQCSCGRKGCLERYASATGLIQSAKESMEQHKDSLMWELCGGDISKVDGKLPFDAKNKGDKYAAEVVTQYINILAAGVINMILLFQPELLVLGGGVAGQKDALINPINEIYQLEKYKTSGKYTQIKSTSCENAGLVGAAMLYNQ